MQRRQFSLAAATAATSMAFGANSALAQQAAPQEGTRLPANRNQRLQEEIGVLPIVDTAQADIPLLKADIPLLKAEIPLMHAGVIQV